MADGRRACGHPIVEAARAARQTAEAHLFSRNVAETLDFMRRIHAGATREPGGQRA